jgi:CheY-like chemotaxis protein
MDKFRVMLIDDDEDDRYLFAEAVHKIDPSIKCETSDNCRQILNNLEYWGNAMPNVIFLDLNMPEIHGFDCLMILKNDRLWKTIPVIIYSTSKNNADMERAEQLGASGYIKKPADFSVLYEKLKDIITLDFTKKLPRAIMWQDN